MSELPAQEGLASPAPAAPAREALPRAVVRLMRPHHWTKNLLVFAALVFAKDLFVARSLGLAGLAFAAFCLASSSVYVVNDVLDIERDRLHPEKRHRPIAAGLVPVSTAWALGALLTAGALGLAFWIRPLFGLAILAYVAMSHFYSFAGKNIVILDVMVIAAGFVLRAVGGALAIDVPSSSWFIVCTLFAALFLALSKRRAEMLALEAGAGSHRPVLKAYTPETLAAFAATSMALVLISYALYVLDVRDQAGGGFQLLELTLPFVLFAVFRYHLLVESGRFGEKPEDVFLRDRPFQLSVLGFVAVALAGLYVAG